MQKLNSSDCLGYDSYFGSPFYHVCWWFNTFMLVLYFLFSAQQGLLQKFWIALYCSAKLYFFFCCCGQLPGDWFKWHYSLLQEVFSIFPVIFLSGSSFMSYYSLPLGLSNFHFTLLLLHYSFPWHISNIVHVILLSGGTFYQSWLLHPS